MATLDVEVIGTLNALLEDERASVEIEVALASDATEYVERDALATMGAEDTEACCVLRERLETLGVAVTRRINGIVFTVLKLERYDDRLRAFADHQRGIAENITALIEQDEPLDREIRRILEAVSVAHERHARWCIQRAEEFALSRQIERMGGPAAVFGPSPHPSNPLTAPAAPEPGIEGLEPDPYQPTPPSQAARGRATAAEGRGAPSLGATAPETPTTPGAPPGTPPDTTLE